MKFKLEIMKFKLERQIPISMLYTNVIKHANDLGRSKGFVFFNQDVLDKMAEKSDEFANEMGWEKAFGQYIYVEYKIKDKDKQTQFFQPVDTTLDIECEHLDFHVWSCEDDVSMEILVTDEMTAYCLAENNLQQTWDKMVHSTSVLLQLYILNKKGERLFWKEIFEINRHLKLIDEKPVIKVLLDKGGDKQQVLMKQPLSETNTLPPVGAKMKLMLEGDMKEFMVSELTYNYLTPFKTLGEIVVLLTEP